MEQCL
jgi:hypothetical protein